MGLREALAGDSSIDQLLDGLFSTVIYLLGVYPLILVTPSLSVFTLIILGALPIVVWWVLSWLSGTNLGWVHFGWSVYLVVLPLLLIVLPAGGLPGFPASWPPLTWVPIGVLGTFLIIGLSIRLHKRLSGTTLGTLFRETGRFRESSFKQCLWMSGVVFGVFGYPLWLLRLLKLNDNPYLLTGWLLLSLTVTVLLSGWLTRVVFYLDPFTSILLSFWPLGFMGYATLFALTPQTVFEQNHPLRAWLFNAINDVYLIPVFIGAVTILGYVVLRWSRALKSRVIRPLINSVILGGLALLTLSALITFMGRFVLANPQFAEPDWTLDSNPVAEKHYQQLHRFGQQLDYDWYEIPRDNQFDTEVFLRNHEDTVDRGITLLSRDLQFPRRFLNNKRTRIPHLSRLSQIIRLKGIHLLNRGDIPGALNQSKWLIDASRNLLKSQAPLHQSMSALDFLGDALDIHQKLIQQELTDSQRSRLHQQLITVSRKPGSISEILLPNILYHLEHTTDTTIREQLMDPRRIRESTFPELWRIGFTWLQSGSSIRDHITHQLYKYAVLLESDPATINKDLYRIEKKSHLMGYLQSYPRTPVSSFWLANFWPDLGFYFRELYSPIRKARQLLHQNHNKAADELAPIPDHLKHDPMTGRPMTEIRREKQKIGKTNNESREEAPRGGINLSNLRIADTTPSEVTLALDYTLNREKPATAAGYPLRGGRSSFFGYQPIHLEPGSGTFSMRISYRTYDPHYNPETNHKPPTISTDGFLIRVRDDDTLLNKRFERSVDWRIDRAGESDPVLPTDTGVNRFSNPRVEKIDTDSVRIIANFQYRSNHGNLTSATAAFGRNNDYSGPYLPGDIERGSGTTAIEINRFSPDVLETDVIYFEMYIPQERTIYSTNLPYEYNWMKYHRDYFEQRGWKSDDRITHDDSWWDYVW